jgi:P27 family predicted phage terminase small subunit
MAVKNTAAVLKFKADIPPPEHLSDAAKSSWCNIVRDYSMHDDVVGLGLLAIALSAWDRWDVARRRIKREGLQVRDRYGKFKPHPLLTVEARAMAEYRSAIKQLHFDLEPVRPSSGRPAGR